METTRDLQSLYLVGKLMEWLVNNLISLTNAAVAVAILIRTLAVLVQSLDRVAPKYLKLVTTSSFSPFIKMCHFYSSNIFCHNAVSDTVVASPRCLISSEGCYLVQINVLPEPLIIFAIVALGVHIHPFMNTIAVLRTDFVRIT
ncbi:hypothetical protein DPMN_054058 [Dreissena polymorpha]|uniref:Uncharacterized protein n=1 Tax=Dreissena polymorpha TaxID=45954 RepID=A0A9D4HR96_DREPO|nr:hypothetical protein DPMN_054058 [Dreissena polymorpha]